MAKFIHLEYSAEHPGVARFGRLLHAASDWRVHADGTKGLAALLLGALVAAVVVVADQMVDTWADGHLMAAWVMMWVIAFAAIGLFGGATRQAASKLMAWGNAWARASAQRRADARLLRAAQADPRILSDLRAARSRGDAATDAGGQVGTTGRKVFYYL